MAPECFRFPSAQTRLSERWVNNNNNNKYSSQCIVHHFPENLMKDDVSLCVCGCVCGGDFHVSDRLEPSRKSFFFSFFPQLLSYKSCGALQVKHIPLTESVVRSYLYWLKWLIKRITIQWNKHPDINFFFLLPFNVTFGVIFCFIFFVFFCGLFIIVPYYPINGLSAIRRLPDGLPGLAVHPGRRVHQQLGDHV